MTIVCGTDFSRNSELAAHTAALLARHWNQPLKLVHVIDELGAELAVSSGTDEIYDPVRQRLCDEAAKLAAAFGIEVKPLAPPGFVAEMLANIARAEHASLLVVSSLGASKRQRWLVGSVAASVAQKSTVPVLVIRDAERIESWLRGEQPLRVLVGLEPGTPLTPMRWLEEFCGPLPHVSQAIEIVAPLRGATRETEAAHGEPPVDGPAQVEPMALKVVVHEGARAVYRELTELAETDSVDLIVVGSHQRDGWARYLHGSVSRGVLYQAGTNVACVPIGG